MTGFDPEKVAQIKIEGKCNTPDEKILEQVQINLKRHLPQVQPFQQNGQTALLVCGGPSLKDTERELIEEYWSGGKIVCVNGTYKWCIERNLKPSAMIMLDAREFNVRFIEPEISGCKYLLASQCHPSAFDLCSDRDVWIWHACCGGESEHEVLKKYYFDRCYPVTLGTTVGIRAISLLRLLGWSKIDIFGLDSCFLHGEHHAYDQPENKDKSKRVWLRPEGRDERAMSFDCSQWHVRQVQDFQELVRARGNFFDLNVRGDGLIAALLKTGAEIQMESLRDDKMDAPYRKNGTREVSDGADRQDDCSFAAKDSKGTSEIIRAQAPD